jgi:hypothetical protein
MHVDQYGRIGRAEYRAFHRDTAHQVFHGNAVVQREPSSRRASPIPSRSTAGIGQPST